MIMKHIGLDAGSVSVKLVVLDDTGRILYSLYQRHKGQPLPVALEMLKTVMNGMGSKDPSLVAHHSSLSLTGSAGRLIGTVLGLHQ
jgi:activator of 2-hydroxyglutaryl-CoA dehydratase